jgi:N-acetylglucosaminyldiphosphoundecaprenol N-acetyl-beta-D-mannosaminyltransferase
MPKTRNLIDINFFSSDRDQLLKLLTQNLSTGKKVVLTPNPEILLLSEKNQNLRNCLLTADINLLDGVGIQLVQLILRKNIAPRHPGRLVMKELLDASSQNSLRVFFFGTNQKVLSDLVTFLKNKYPLLKFEYSPGPQFDVNGEPKSGEDGEMENQAIKKINAFKPHFLFVALGAPKQELWILKNKSKLNANVFMAVGGSLDAISGNTIFVPDFINRLGLEWLFRLIGQPRRFMRIVNATVVFLFRSLISKS